MDAQLLWKLIEYLPALAAVLLVMRWNLAHLRAVDKDRAEERELTSKLITALLEREIEYKGMVTSLSQSGSK